MARLSQRDSITAEVVTAVPQGLLIAGRWRESRGGRTLLVDDPSTGAPLLEVADGGPDDARAALDAAAAARDDWASAAPRRRASILRDVYGEVRDRSDELALMLTLEMGKPIQESRDEIEYGAEYLLWFAEEAIRIDGRYATAPDGSGRVLVLQQPVGPCLVITPWNFPFVMATRAIAPAIAAGCTLVVKPSKLAPLTTMVLGDIFTAVGLPPGVLNIVLGSRSRALIEPLITDSRLRKITFTGSTDVGRDLLQQSAMQVLRCSLELGGNAPFIVFEDADIDDAVAGAMVAKMRNGGQACTSANRFYIHRGVVDAFTARLGKAMAAMRVGPGVDPAVTMGPLIDNSQRRRVADLVDRAVTAGARVVTGGQAVEGSGFFYEPTVLANVTDDMAVVREEIFGPVAPIMAFEDESEVVTRANDTELGLAAYVYTQDFHRALRVIEGLETGMVGLNQGKVSNPMAPFGGIKHSGLGRAGGPEAIGEYLETKYVAIRHGNAR